MQLKSWLPQLFSQAFAAHERRVMQANPSQPIFMGFGWVLLALLTFYVGGFMLTNRTDASMLFLFMPWVLALLVPALTMHTWAQDFKTGTAERLLSLPIPLSALHLSRFAVIWAQVGLFLAGTWPFVGTLFWLGAPDVGPLLTGYLGAWLLGGVLVAVGLGASAIARSYISAFLGALVANIVLLLSGWQQLTDALHGILPTPVLQAMVSSSVTENLQRFVVGDVALASIGFFTLLMALMLAAGLAVLHRRAQQQPGLSRTAFMALGAGAGLSIMAMLTPWRLDATADRLFTLSPATIQLVKNLSQPVEFTLFDSRSNLATPPTLPPLRQRLHDVLADLQRAAPGKIRITTRDPWASLAAEISATQAGIIPQNAVTNQPFYFGVMASLGGRNMALPEIQPERQPYLEFDVSSLLAELMATRRKNLTILSGTNLADPNVQPPWLTRLGAFYNIRFSRPGEPQLPPDTDVLVVFPSPFLPQESLYAFDQFMTAGGRALVLLDPFLRSAPAENLMQADRNADALGLDHPADVLRSWGIQYDWNVIVGDNARATPVQASDAIGGTGLGYTTYPLWLTLTAENLNPHLPFTSYVTQLMLPEPGELNLGTLSPGLKAETLLSTAPSAQVLSREQFSRTQPELAGGLLGQKPQTRVLGALVYGNFPSTFQGMPTVVQQYYADYQTPSSSIPPFIPQSQAQGALVVVADADWVADSFAINDKVSPPRPANDNLPFLYNTIQYLAGDGSLLGLRAKGLNQRPFTRLQQQLGALAAQYTATEQQLATDLFTATNRLAQLETRSNESALLSQRDEDEIQSWQARTLQLKQQLRQVRQQAGTHLARSTHLLAWANALLMPALWLGWGWVRRRRQRAANA